MSIYLAFGVLAIVAICFVVNVVRTFFSGHPFSAVISVVIVAAIASSAFWIVLTIIAACFRIVFYMFQLVFKNAVWFTLEILVALGIWYLSIHPEESGKFWDSLCYRKEMIQCVNCNSRYSVLIPRMQSNPARYYACPRCNATIDIKQGQH